MKARFKSYGVFTRSSKRLALARVFWIHLLEVCWTFAGSCKHPISYDAPRFHQLPGKDVFTV